MQRQGFFENIMKLYNLPRDTFFTIQEDDSKTVYFLENVDGMFSYCKNEAGNVVHFSASLEVDIYE
jgi:uncharacterized FAD-dependent dehydrogenase